MNVNPAVLEKMREKEKYKKHRKTLDALRQREHQSDPHNVRTEQVKNENISNLDVNLDSDLTGMGNASLGAGIPDTINPSA